MTASIFERLAGIRQFLGEEILPCVPGDKRGDLRAALKMLEDMAKEIDRLPGLLELEIAEMLHLCDAAVAALGWDGVDQDDLQSLKEFALEFDKPGKRLSELLALHTGICVLVSNLAIQLTAKVAIEPEDQKCLSGPRVVLAKSYRLLRRQAEARTSWQSVFPGGRLYPASGTPIKTIGDG
ncbi:hypothetical protein [Sphingobium baderi]|uniref:Uncharacterized protein n=1 Tax=Sphingobium baderi LL03 TaxID=1114964 RepID=T0HU47_9SPHN|nr:hypothetical protein [Sphingobium baderi]EQB01054.1 hypothetical protein L485_11360 [Sphingobium baderi LL03]KMS61044.1 hypothetical protein V475_16005 [Sphingobium baderi LL03]